MHDAISKVISGQNSSILEYLRPKSTELVPYLAHVIQLSLQQLLGKLRIDPTNEELKLN